MNAPTTAAEAVSYLSTVQQALTIVNTLNLYAYLNPYDGCVANNSVYDYIVVGGGTSGSPIASRLSEDKNVNVLLVEAGGNIGIESVDPGMKLFTLNGQYEWNYTAAPNKIYAECHRNNLERPVISKVLGGKSSIDIMIGSEGACRNYDLWAKITQDSSWSCANVLRLLKRIEKLNDTEIENSSDGIYHGYSGTIGFTRDRSPIIDKYFVAFNQGNKKVVRDINNNTKIGVSGATYRYYNGMRQNTATQYLVNNGVRKRKNLTIIKYCVVTKLIFNENKRAVALQVYSYESNRTYVIRANKEIIVAAGTTNTAKLLQLSGIGTEKLLDYYNISKVSVLPVGLNLKCHVSTVIVGATQKTKCTVVPENNNPHNYPSPTIISYASVNNSKPYAEYRTINYILPVTPGTSLLEFGAKFFRFRDEVVDYWYKNTIGRESMFTRVEANNPESCGQVRIRSLNFDDPPIIETNYFSEPSDMEDMVKYVKDFVQIYDTPLFKEFGAYIVDPTSCDSFEGDDYWRCYIKCLMSPSGDCVGTAALGSVVDGQLRVKDVECLRVADSSIMPDMIQGGTTLPEIMIGENCAEMIKRKTCANYYK